MHRVKHKIMSCKETEKQTLKTVRHRVERALKMMGYPFSIEELHDDVCRIHLAYQGEDFLIDIDERDYIRMQLIDGTYALVEDVEEFSRVRRAINEANWKSSVTIVYTILEEEQELLLNYQFYALAIPQIPCFDKYLEYELDQFYDAQLKVWYELKKMKREEDQLKQELSLPSDDYDKHRLDFMKQKDETQDLFLETLEEMGCPYSIDEEYNFILFEYKNVHLLSHVNCEWCEITIHCRGWELVNLNDIDEVMHMKQAVNIANSKGHLTTYFKNDYESHELVVSSSAEIYFSSHIKDRKNYLRNKFDDFIDVQQTVQIEMEALRTEN